MDSYTSSATTQVSRYSASPATWIADAPLSEDQSRSAASAAAHRDAMVLQSLPIVRQVAKQIRFRLPQHVELEELVAAGTMGLLDAAEKFDSSKEVQFASYARLRIRGAILDSLRMLDWSPRELRKKHREIRQAQGALSLSMGRTPEDHEVASALAMALSDYQHLLAELDSLEIGSLQEERGVEQVEVVLDQVAAPEEESPLRHCLQAELREHLAKAIDTLPEKERLVLTLRYYEELSVREIATVLGVVESRVSQLHRAAMNRLRAQVTK